MATYQQVQLATHFDCQSKSTHVQTQVQTCLKPQVAQLRELLTSHWQQASRCDHLCFTRKTVQLCATVDCLHSCPDGTRCLTKLQDPGISSKLFEGVRACQNF